jgi:hypothetical protein
VILGGERLLVRRSATEPAASARAYLSRPAICGSVTDTASCGYGGHPSRRWSSRRGRRPVEDRGLGVEQGGEVWTPLMCSTASRAVLVSASTSPVDDHVPQLCRCSSSYLNAASALRRCDHLVARVPRRVDQLLGEEPDVQSVQDRTHRGHRQIGDEVPGVVPHERRRPLVTGDSDPGARRRPAARVPRPRGTSFSGRRRRSTSRPPVGIERRPVAHQLGVVEPVEPSLP